MSRISMVQSDNTRTPYEIVYVARMVPLKRHSLLFDIIKEVPQARLVLLGMGPLYDELVSEAQEKGIQDRVEFTGALSRDDAYLRLKKASIYVSTSSYEGLPISVIEAMACKLPCVVSNIVQHEEIKKSCPSLILADSVEDWRDKIESLLFDANLEKIGEKLHEEVTRSFSLDAMHKQYDSVYKL